MSKYGECDSIKAALGESGPGSGCDSDASRSTACRVAAFKLETFLAGTQTRVRRLCVMRLMNECLSTWASCSSLSRCYANTLHKCASTCSFDGDLFLVPFLMTHLEIAEMIRKPQRLTSLFKYPIYLSNLH